MNSDDRKRLLANRDLLLDNLRAQDLIDYLYQEYIIDEEEKELIASVITTRGRAARLLSTLLEKPDPEVLNVFCQALRRDDATKYLAEAIEQVDPATIEECDEPDLTVRENENIITLSNQLKSQNVIIHTQQIQLATLQEELATVRSDMKSMKELFDLARYSLNSKTKKSLTFEIAEDLLRFVTAKQQTATRKKCFLTMRKAVTEILKRQMPLFQAAIVSLALEKQEGFDTLSHVGDEMFTDGVINWGRIATFSAFVAYVAKKFRENGDMQAQEFLADFLGMYLDREMIKDWIDGEGGWDACVVWFNGNQSWIYRSLSWVTGPLLWMTRQGVDLLRIL